MQSLLDRPEIDDPVRAKFFAGREILIGLTLLGLVNSQYIRIFRQLTNYSVLDALVSTLGISLVVWVAALSVLSTLSKSASFSLNIKEYSVSAVSFLLFISPVTGLSAVGLTLMGGYFSLFGRTPEVKTAMRLLIALAVAVMWGRLAMSFFLPYILQIDATLASLLTGLDKTGNLVFASDGKTVLQVGAGCSSFLNVTNATLGWFTAMIVLKGVWSVRAATWLICSISTIIAINTLRIGLIGWYPDYFWLIHGGIGSNVANICSSIAILYFSLRAARK
ncbi:hypothetical protein [Oryzifoliimicrobium ureilyticus]|uniref:hypothetical protein n=1 Tax=Oryzifoliimicrobium ureilyticus TaxID=3113724 RepID=UPI0030768110